MKLIYLSLFGILFLLYTILDYNLNISKPLPQVTMIFISICCIALGMWYKDYKVNVIDIFKEIF